MVAAQIDLVDADDAYLVFHSHRIDVDHRRTEEYIRLLQPGSRCFRIDYLCGFDSLGKKTDPSIDLA